MVSVTFERRPGAVPGAGRRTAQRLRRLRDLARAGAAELVRPHRAALSNLAHMPLTLAAAGCIDAAGFTHSVFTGLIVTAVSLVYLEHVIADED